HTRSAMMQTLAADYVRTARAKSVPERLVVLKHALRNALIPVITLGAIEFGRLLSGAVLTEQIFNIPGFGKLLVDGVFNRDYAVVQAGGLGSPTPYVLLNPLSAVLYFAATPRMPGRAWPPPATPRSSAVPRARPPPRSPPRAPCGPPPPPLPARRPRPSPPPASRGPPSPSAAPTGSAATSGPVPFGARAPRCWPG